MGCIAMKVCGVLSLLCCILFGVPVLFDKEVFGTPYGHPEGTMDSDIVHIMCDWFGIMVILFGVVTCFSCFTIDASKQSCFAFVEFLAYTVISSYSLYLSPAISGRVNSKQYEAVAFTGVIALAFLAVSIMSCKKCCGGKCGQAGKKCCGGKCEKKCDEEKTE